MSGLIVDVWLYGALARFGAGGSHGYANLAVSLSEGSTMADLLARLSLPTGERGITFVNGQLSAMPGLQPDLGRVLRHGDRVALFDPRSMWPCQYRLGAPMAEELARALQESPDQGLRHAFDT